MKKILIVLFVFAAFNSVSGQVNNYANTDVTALDVFHYLYFKASTISKAIHDSTKNKKLVAYSDPELKKALKQQEFSDLFYFKEEIELPDSSYPDAINGWGSYSFASEIDPESIRGLKKTGNSLKYMVNEARICYFDFKKVSAILSAEQKTLFTYLENKGFNELTDATYKEFALKEFFWFSSQLYKWGSSGKLTAYWNCDMDSTYTLNGIKERVFPKENELLGDSFIIKPFLPDSIKKIRLCVAYTKTGNYEYKVTPRTIGPMFKPVIAGLQLPYMPVFLVSHAAAVPLLTKEQNAFYSDFLLCHIINKGNEENHRNFIYEPEYPPAGFETE